MPGLSGDSLFLRSRQPGTEVPGYSRRVQGDAQWANRNPQCHVCPVVRPEGEEFGLLPLKWTVCLIRMSSMSYRFQPLADARGSVKRPQSRDRKGAAGNVPVWLLGLIDFAALSFA